MSRSRNKYRIYSSISDEQLAVIMAGDFHRSPSEFSNKPFEDKRLKNDEWGKTLLNNTSGRAIEPIRKWL